MGKIALLGCSESKRTVYFLNAASQLGADIEFHDIRHFDKNALTGKLVKIDPFVYECSEIGQMDALVSDYIKTISGLCQIPGIRFLNSPEAIAGVLSKDNCKNILLENNVSTATVLGFNIGCYDDLREKMRLSRLYNVFIKPNRGSGAAGVIAYRLHPQLDREVMYSSVALIENKLINTKKIRKYEETSVIKEIINHVLSSGALVEKWIPKARHLSFTYDLRVVVQFGKVDFMVCRLSKNPITNLHLNNNAADINELGLSPGKLNEIKELCVKAVGLFEGLTVAGVDLLLTKDNLTPVVIEINAQGDLIYQDIYNENIIYKNQIIGMDGGWNAYG